MYLMIHFSCRKLKKMYLNSFSNLTLIHLLPVLDLQTNWMTVHQQRIFRTSTPVFLAKRELRVLLLKMKMRPNQY